MPLHPPLGWLALQERAKQAKDPRALAAIIDEMNELLAEYEKTSGDGHGKGRPQERSAKPVKKSVKK